MKELSIEEKAKAYDKKLAEAKEMLKDGGISQNTIDYIQKLYPELAESEDERIRKCLIDLVNGIDTPRFYGVDRKAAIAWLEKQGEQKPVEWSEEDELCFEQIDFLIRNSYSVKDYYKTLSDWFKSLKDRVQPQVNVRKLIEKLEWLENTKTTIWSEDDEAMRKTTLQYLENTKGSCAAACVPYIVKCIDWLNSLKDRVQPKQEWSEEDYNEIETIACHLDNINNEGMAEVLRNIRDKYYSQSKWKPSEEQFKLLKHIIENVPLSNIDKSEVGNLYLDLKKLTYER